MANKGQRMIFENEYEYLKDLKENHPDPSASWGGGSGGTPIEAGTGIEITGTDTKTISIDNTVETKANATNRFVSKANLTDYSINEIIVGNSQVDSDTVDLKAVYSQDVKSEISAEPTSTIIRTMSGTDVSTIGISATEIDLTTSMLKYNSNEVATKNEIPDEVSGTNDGTNWTSLTIGNDTYGLASGGGTSYIAGNGIDITGSTISIDTSVVAEVSDIPTKTSDLDNDSGFITGIDSADVISALGYTPGTSNFDGDYDSLTNKPTIPTAVSQLTNDSGYITGITATDVTNALGYTPGTSNFSGDYDDLTDKPDLSIYATSASLSAVAFSGDYDDLIDKPTLATVATTGSYNDLSNKPTIPDTTNFVTTNTNQEITGEKTFTGNKRIKFKGTANNSRLGFTGYDQNDVEVGYLEMCKNDSTFNGANSNVLGYYSSTQSSGTTPSRDPMLGFKYQTKDSTGTTRQLNLVVPTRATASTGINYMPISVNGTKADNTGNVSLSIPTDTSDLTNGAGYITGITSGMITTALGYTPGTSNFSGSYTDLTDKPTLATVAISGDYSDLTNTPTITNVVANTGSTATATLTDLQVGSTVYEIPQGGGGSSYTFTNGLTESGGTVSWDLNNNFKYNISGRSIVSGDAANFDANNACQNSCVYMPSSSLNGLSNNRYNNGIIAFGNSLYSAGSSGSCNQLILFGNGLSAKWDASNTGQIIIGSYNVTDNTKALIIADGKPGNEHNLMTIDRNGNLECNNIPAVDTTTDGTYVLEATVASGTVTYSWVLKQ